MKLNLKRIHPTSLAIVLGLIYLLIGLFVGLFGLAASITGGNLTLHGPFRFSGTGKALGFVSLFYPLITGFVGCVSGLIIAWIYNFIAGFTGGVSLDLIATQSDLQANRRSPPEQNDADNQ